MHSQASYKPRRARGTGRKFASCCAAGALQAFAVFEGHNKLEGVAMAEFSLGPSEAFDRALARFIEEKGIPFADQYAEAYAWRGEKDEAFECWKRLTVPMTAA